MNLVLTNNSRTITAQKQRRYQALKRLMDIVICIVAFPVALPVALLCALFIRLEGSPGPVLFKQDRIGRDGKLFTIYKFRTMHHNLDDSGHRAFMKAYINGQIGESTTKSAATTGNAEPPLAGAKTGLSSKVSKLFSRGKKRGHQIFKPFESSQITRMGRILRKTSLDELPQLLNVIKGDMSIVGPRPNVKWEVEAYNDRHCDRLNVLPGITGLAQVRGRSSLTFDEIVEYDIEYIESMDLLLDVKILWWTFTSAVIGKGAG